MQPQHAVDEVKPIKRSGLEDKASNESAYAGVSDGGYFSEPDLNKSSVIEALSQTVIIRLEAG
jgi:hypothetical protein